MQKIECRILVINFDPIVPTGGAGTRLHTHIAGFWDPRMLVDEAIRDISTATRGMVQLSVAEWTDVDAIPRKADGFQYSIEEWLRNKQQDSGWHTPDLANYDLILSDHHVAEKINSGLIDEVWLFGGPYFGFGEVGHAGPEAFYLNGPTLPYVRTSRRFVIMGFNYEVHVDNLLHAFCHRVEGLMTHHAGGWEAHQLVTDWAVFASNLHQSKVKAVCGSCHYPPNAERDYDYANPKYVLSSADDWLTYPHLTGQEMQVNRDNWKGPHLSPDSTQSIAYQRNYMMWWFSHLPHGEGVNPKNGWLCNWWFYVFEGALMRPSEKSQIFTLPGNNDGSVDSPTTTYLHLGESPACFMVRNLGPSRVGIRFEGDSRPSIRLDPNKGAYVTGMRLILQLFPEDMPNGSATVLVEPVC